MLQQRCIKLTYSVWGSKTGSCGEQACKCASVCVFVAFVINGNIRQLKDTRTHAHTHTRPSVCVFECGEGV